MQQPPSSLSFTFAFTALVVGACAMGVSPVFVRFAEVGPFASAFWRAALALPFLFLWMQYEVKKSGEPLHKFLKFDKIVILSGVFFAGDLFFWHLAIVNTTIANATLLATLAPVWVALFSGHFIGEPITRGTVLGLAICCSGALMLIGDSYVLVPERLIGDLYGLATSVFFGLYFLCIRVARRKHSAGSLTFMSTSVTAAILLVVTLISQQNMIPATMTGFLALLALGIISHTGGQGLLTLALGSLSATFSSLVIFIEALAAALLGWLIFNEDISLIQGAGGLLILIGIWIARPQQNSGSDALTANG